ncbi:MAG: DUF3795 domain-containing protein [Candidatus Bathyarchaeia archaeon]|jgi:hypothetical protein
MTDHPFTPDLIAPCGMNCGVCKAYLAYSRNVPYKKGEVSHCSGCIERNKNCAFIKKGCEKIRKKQFRFCYECPDMPCERLEKIDQYYSARYGMSMVENQKMMKEKGVDVFLRSQTERYKCPSCGDVVSVHDGKCYACGLQTVKPKGSNPKHRWVPNSKKT